jgi:hypothetical protein
VDATQGLDVGLGRQRDVGQRACIIIGVWAACVVFAVTVWFAI